MKALGQVAKDLPGMKKTESELDETERQIWADVFVDFSLTTKAAHHILLARLRRTSAHANAARPSNAMA
jgi:hypothetical protein